jgi:predicted SAM-dependent methyltransferase
MTEKELMIRKFIKDHTTKGVRIALLKLRDEFEILRQHRRGLKQAKRFASQRDLKLHIGCGPNHKDGWVNLDLGGNADLQLDLREGLPFSDNSAVIVYSEHFFEHLSYTSTVYSSDAFSSLEAPGYPSEALLFLRESFRILKSGGVFSVGVPDAEKALKAYTANDQESFLRERDGHPKWCRTYMDHVNYTFRQGEQHKYAYDCETLSQLLQAVGFVDIRRRDFNPALDIEKRRLGTLYMEAQKPNLLRPDSP